MVWNSSDVLFGKRRRENNSGLFRRLFSVQCEPEEVCNFTEKLVTEIQDSLFQGSFSVADFVGPDGPTPMRDTKDSLSTAEGSRPGALDVLSGSYQQMDE